MSKIYKLLTFIILFVVSTITVNAEITVTGIVNVSDGLNIRDKANTSGKVIATIPNGYNLSLVSTTKYSGTGCSKGWYQVKYKSKTGYVCSNYVSNVKSVNTEDIYDGSDWTYRINDTNVSFRKDDTSLSGVIQTFNYGTNVTYIKKASKNNGCTNNYWYLVSYNGKEGYVCSTYLSKKNSVTDASTTYNSTWSKAGFPSSYYPYLTYLKKKYPKATFTAVKTNTNFIDAVSSEYGSNYIQTSDSNLRTSSKQVETGGWYKAKNQTIAYYLDPRNFMDEKSIFIFEDNKYNSTAQTANVVKDVFDGGKLQLFAGDFLTAGKNTNMNPVHLATRSRQEIGINGNDATKGPYYNFYNIGAYSSCSNPLACGLEYAKNKGWDTPVKSIVAGANLLKNNYYNNNQKTRYYEKFNVINGKYSNQYMTNINAPIAEALTAYEKYSSNGVLNSNFNFIIPVFNNMPNVTSLPSGIAIQSTTVSAPTTKTSAAVVPTVTNVKAELVTKDSIKVTFNKVDNAKKYKIWYKKDNESWKKVTVYTNTKTFTSLTKGAKYTFKVKAWVGSEKSEKYSSEVSTYTLIKPTITLKKNNSKSIKVSWNKVNGTTNCKVYRKTYGGKWKKQTNTTSTSFISNGIKKKTTYYYKVRCYVKVHGKKIHSDYSSVISKKI